MRVTPYRLMPDRAQQRIRQLAQVSESVILGTHARERLVEREIDDTDVHRALKGGGSISGNPEPAEPGEWKCKIVMAMKGGRSIGVVVIILRTNKLFVKTVEWEDLK